MSKKAYDKYGFAMRAWAHQIFDWRKHNIQNLKTQYDQATLYLLKNKILLPDHLLPWLTMFHLHDTLAHMQLLPSFTQVFHTLAKPTRLFIFCIHFPGENAFYFVIYFFFLLAVWCWEHFSLFPSSGSPGTNPLSQQIVEYINIFCMHACSL